MSQEVYILKETRGSRYRRQLPRNAHFFCASLPVFCISNLLFIALPLIAYLCFCTPIANADVLEEHSIYILSPGDSLLITVVGHEKDAIAGVIRSDGMITYPVIGDVKAAGLTTAQLSAVIGEQLSILKFYKDPEVTVQLRRARHENIYVFGEVVTPGEKSFPRSVSVVEVLAAAGGFGAAADLANARIIKRRREVIPVDLRVLLDDPDAISARLLDDRFMLGDGDVLMIPSSVKTEPIIITGHVGNAGQFRVKSDINLVEALALAGGPAGAADLRHIRIIKPDGSISIGDATGVWDENGEKQPHQIDKETSPFTFYIQPGDTMFVPMKAKINILGNVQTQGRFYVYDEVSIIEALTLAGGPAGAADLRHIKIIKPDGSVSIANATGVWDENGEKQPYQMDEEANPFTYYVQPGDTMFVPTKGKINIIGSVMTQGRFYVDDEISIIEALALVGIEKNANLKKLRIIRSTGERVVINASKIWKKQGQEAEVKLEPGDTLIVPDSFQINWSAISTVVMLLSTMYAIFR